MLPRRAVVTLTALALLGCTAGSGESGAFPTPTPHPPTTPSPADASPLAAPTTAPTADPLNGADAACLDPLGCYGEPQRAAQFDVERVPEASGLAASRRNPGILYLLDDRPGTGEVWALALDGSMFAPITIVGLDARDTESLAVGPCAADGEDSCVYVGDIGDNLRTRSDIVVHRFAEPDLSDGAPTGTVEARAMRLRYPEEPHDAEALLVDDRGVVFIVTKGPFDGETRTTGEARLLRAEEFADGVLTDLGPVPVPEPETPLQSLFVGNVVTGGDYLAGRVLLRTYDQVLEYVAPEPSAPLSELATWTVRSVPAPPEVQSEAIAWAPGGCGYYTAGEGSPEVWFVPCTLTAPGDG